MQGHSLNRRRFPPQNNSYETPELQSAATGDTPRNRSSLPRRAQARHRPRGGILRLPAALAWPVSTRVPTTLEACPGTRAPVCRPGSKNRRRGFSRCQMTPGRFPFRRQAGTPEGSGWPPANAIAAGGPGSRVGGCPSTATRYDSISGGLLVQPCLPPSFSRASHADGH